MAIMVTINTIAIAQNTPKLVASGSIKIPKNTAPCLSSADYEALQAAIENNISDLKKSGKLQPINPGKTHPLFDWPVRQADGFNYGSIYNVINYIDHDPAYPNQIIDYNCGRHSYDTQDGYNHPGFDILVWPFWWKQMDRNQAINVAAADGQIIEKQDGYFDKSCSFNNRQWNGIVLLHSDGSKSYYFHMKNGSVTSKEIGDSVSRGEYLGVVGSSGNSNVPHLHFEVRDSNNQLIDPSSGPCNNWNSDSWWVSQKPYLEPGVMAVLTHDALPVFPSCPQIEVTNEKDNFAIRVPYYLGVYIRNPRRYTNLQLKVIRPNNTNFSQWLQTIEVNDDLSYYVFSGNSDLEGVWTFEATYEGHTESHQYYIGELGTQENDLTDTYIFPNPGSLEINIVTDHQITQVSFLDVLGRTVSEVRSASGLKKIDVSNLSKGIYFVRLTSSFNASKTLKFIKE